MLNKCIQRIKINYINTLNTFNNNGNNINNFIISGHYHFCEKILQTNKPKMIKITYDSENNKKITYEDYQPIHIKTKPQQINNVIDDKEETIQNKSYNSPSVRNKIFFGKFEIEKEDQVKHKIPEEINYSKQNNDEINDEINENENSDFDGTSENLIKYDQFFSDHCRIYVKGGDGGKGLFSFNKGTMYDDCK